MKIKIHFNRINMQRGLDTVWTIHTYKQCIPAKSVIIKVPLDAIYKPQSRQPRAWMECKGRIIKELGQDAYTIVP